MHKLLDNAAKSIKLGVEDFQSNDEDRILSAVRNIYAGVLLMYKEKLRQLSPLNSNESLIKAKIIPEILKDGSVLFVGKGNKTVDRHQIQERLKSCGIIIDIKMLKKIADIRNDLEHYFANQSKKVISEAVASAFILIDGFLVKHLQEEPAKLLGNDCWKVMLDEKDLFEHKKNECLATLKKVDWYAERVLGALQQFKCYYCGVSLVGQVEADNTDQSCLELKCEACGKLLDPETILSEALKESMSSDIYSAIKDACEYPLDICPECSIETFIVEESKCASCSFIASGSNCVVCCHEISLEEYSPPKGEICTHHFYLLKKDD